MQQTQGAGLGRVVGAELSPKRAGEDGLCGGIRSEESIQREFLSVPGRLQYCPYRACDFVLLP
jgi:hypothetical protein